MWGGEQKGLRKEALSVHFLGFTRAQFRKSDDTMVKCILYFPFRKIYTNIVAYVLISLINIYVVLL